MRVYSPLEHSETNKQQDVAAVLNAAVKNVLDTGLRRVLVPSLPHHLLTRDKNSQADVRPTSGPRRRGRMKAVMYVQKEAGDESHSCGESVFLQEMNLRITG